MKLLQVYNQYRSLFGGEEMVVANTAALVERRGGEARLLMRSSRGLERSLSGKLRAFASGIYSRSAYRETLSVIDEYRPDVAHAHNLYPLLSPSVLVALRRAGVPVVLSVHNHAFTCPTTDHLHRGQICERCFDGGTQWCVLKNCRGNLFESAAYALRTSVARRTRVFQNNVTLVIALTEFARQRLIRMGFQADRVEVLPNMVEVDHEGVDASLGQYVAFAGRMSREKGVDTLLAAAARVPEVRFRLAGDGPLLDEGPSAKPINSAEKPDNTQWLGRLSSPEVAAVYRGARFVVVPSTCYEMCPLVISEAMSHGLPVIASRVGGLPELVDDGVTGLLFERGNAQDLAAKIRWLWQRPDVCREMGQRGREKALRKYGEENYYHRLMNIYERAIELARQEKSHDRDSSAYRAADAALAAEV